MLPIAIYGNPVLRKVAKEIDKDYPNLNNLIESIEDSMYKSDGVGLAAPQINKSIRLFIIDGTPLAEDYPEVDGFHKIFINAQIIEEEGKEWSFNEGCLSLPDIREEVKRKPRFLMSYFDENWEHHEEWFEGMQARIIQHEYDHLDGILFTDRLTPLRRKLLKSRLTAISKNKISVGYKFIINK